MANDIKLTIDDVDVTVPAGTTIFWAARTAGVEIPHLCYDPTLDLPSTSSCRLCVVEVEGATGLVASCSHPVAPGMVVRTDTDALREVRRSIIELLLSDHPHDCLTCDTAGACALQDYAYQFGVKQSRYAGAAVSIRPIQDGPAIVYDGSKCIVCGRCVHVCHDVQVAGAVDFIGRGFDTRIGLPPGLPRDDSTCEECGNCIDVCPTGALSFAGAIGAGRVWELQRVATICPYCGVGCTIVLNVCGNRVVKATGKAGLGVSNGRLCVKGRFGLDFINHPERLTQPLLRTDGRLLPATWDDALSFAARRLGEIRRDSGPDSIGVLASAKCTNEENYLMQKFARAVIGTNNVDHCARLCHASTVAGLGQAFGSGAMTNSMGDLDEAGAILVIGSNTTECHPIIGAAIKRAAVQRGVPLIVADPRAIDLTEFAAVHLRQRHGTDVALINALIHVILSEGLEERDFIRDRTEGFESLRAAVEPYTPGLAAKITRVPAEDIIRAARIYAQAPAGAIVYSMGITQHTTGTDNVLALANLAMVTGNVGKPGSGVNPLRGQNNVQGACDVGALPDVFPGYQRVTDDAVRARFGATWGVPLPAQPGLTTVEMLNPDAGAGAPLRALYIMGENPVLSDPDGAHVREALGKLDLLIVQDIFLSETAQLADVVFPATSFAEKEGTFTNTERRVQRVRRVLAPPGEARQDAWIICDLALRMGRDIGSADPSAVQDEIASLTPIYAGITYERLDAGALQWPCPDRGHPGTPILHVGAFTRGRGKFHPVEFIPARELPDDEYPFVLSTGRILQHYHTGTMSRRSQVLDRLVPAGAIEISPEDAERLGVRDGATVSVRSRRGRIEIAARIVDRVTPGTVFLAFHYREAPANWLTIAALDPVAKIPELKVCAVTVEAIPAPPSPHV
jgi:formate dehydrogenase alpha subunit